MKYLIVSFCLGIALFSCTSNVDTEKTQIKGVTVNSRKEAKNGKAYGGTFRMNESEYVTNLFPPHIIDAHSARVANQIYNGLFKFNQETLELEKDLVESYTTNSDNTEFTFKIKQGVKFHNNPCFENGVGRELTAKDVQFCFDKLCTDDTLNYGFVVFHDFLVGANDYFNQSRSSNRIDHVRGVKVIDDYTIQLKLVKPNSLFLYNLAEPFAYIYPEESLTKYGADIGSNPVGTGPFMLDKPEDFIEEDHITLKHNPYYFGKDDAGNDLPFLDALHITFVNDKKEEVELFKQGELDMIYHIPTDYVIELMIHNDSVEEVQDYVHQNTAEMSTHFLGFLLDEKSIFSNVNLRKSISYAVDRTKIMEFVLQGEAHEEGIYGITPPNAFPEYHADSIQGFEFDPDSAQYYYNLSGTRLKNLTLDYNSDGERNMMVAQEVQSQLKEYLDIEVTLNPVPLQNHMDNIISGKSEFYLIDWVYEYPHPENFLLSFYSHEINKGHEKSFPNYSRYENESFDRLFEKALYETNPEKITAEFKEAEQELINQAPVVVLWYDESYRLLQHYVKDFENNAMQYRDLREVYFQKSTLIEESSID